MVVVNTEDELNEAFDKNNENIELGQDITIKEFKAKSFSHILDGKNYTIKFNINNNDKYQYWLLLSGTIMNIRFSGNIVWTYDATNDKKCGFLAINNTQSIPVIHHILFEDFKISSNFAFQHTSYSIIGYASTTLGSPVYIHDIQFKDCNFKMEDFTATKLFDFDDNVSGNALIERIAFDALPTNESIYHSIFPNARVRSAYAYGISIIDYRSEYDKRTVPKGQGYDTLESGYDNNLYFNQNCKFQGGSLKQSLANGILNDTPHFELMGFNDTNKWDILNLSQIRLSQFFEKAIKIRGPINVNVNTTGIYVAILEGIKGNITWTIDGEVVGTEQALYYKPKTPKNQILKVSCINDSDKQIYEASMEIHVVALTIVGDRYGAIGEELYYFATTVNIEEEVKWNINDKFYKSGKDIDIKFNTEGEQKITAFITDVSVDFIVQITPIHIKFDNAVKVKTTAKFSAELEGKIIEVNWDFNGEEKKTGGEVIYIWDTIGTKNITITYKGSTITIQQDVLNITFEGNNYFINKIEHTVTATATIEGGDYIWNDGILGKEHKQIYKDYNDGDTIELSVTYIYKDSKISASFSIVCYNSKVYLESDKYDVGLNDTINLTSYQQGLEIPISEKLYHKTEALSDWEELKYSPSYEYQFNDKDMTTHHFKYEVNYEKQGLLAANIIVKTQKRELSIIKPKNNNKIYVNFPVSLEAKSYGMENPIKWNIGVKGNIVEYTFAENEIGNKLITVECEEENKIYTDSINLIILKQDDITVTIPNVFYPYETIHYQVESKFGRPMNHITWEFEDGEISHSPIGDYKFKKTYKSGEKVIVKLHVEFIDDLNNIVEYNKNIELKAINPSVTIIKPVKNINIFVNTLVDFYCEIKHITNPYFEWLIEESTGERAQEFKYTFTKTGQQKITVICTGDEGTFTDTINVNIIDYPILRIEHPDYFINKVPAEFVNNSYNHLNSISWTFSNGTSDYGNKITKVFDDYKDNDLIKCDVKAIFIDGTENTVEIKTAFSIKCVTPKITITSPQKNINIYEGFDIKIEANIEYITNPIFIWSTGEDKRSFMHKFKFGDSNQISVICKCDESKYTGKDYQDEITINIMKADEIDIISPKSNKFINDTPIQFTAEADHDFSIVWYFPSGKEYYEKDFTTTIQAKEFEIITINVKAQFADDLGNILMDEKSINLTCVSPKVIIIKPENEVHVYKDFDITFEAQSSYITNPQYRWSIDNKTKQIVTYNFDIPGTYKITVTCTGDEGTFTDSIIIYIMERDKVDIIAPSVFSNDVPIKFIAVCNYWHVISTSWEFPNEEYDTGYEVEHIFHNYKKGSVITVTLYVIYEDDLKNTFSVKKSIELLNSLYLCSFYENPNGKRFYFDESCKILQKGISGFSEIQLATTVFNTQQYNIINGINISDRQITFNILISYSGKKETYDDIQKILTKIHTKKQELIHELTPTKKLGTLYYIRDDWKVFTIKCNIALGYPIFYDEATKDGWFGTISFIAPNGYWEGEEITEKSDEINNIGDIPCGFKAKLTDNLINTTNNTGIYALNEKSIKGYTVDTTDGIIIDGNGNNAWNDISVNSTLVKLEVGKNVITGCETVTYKPRYLGI